MKSERFRGGQCLYQIVPDFMAALVIVPPPEMQVGFQQQLDSASDEMKKDLARMGIARRSKVMRPGEETGCIVEEIFPPPAPR
ncbi:MAG: hypothetical protein BroJett024_38290 [Alphaproteobacteria bacterium]|nr:MAG: hypothetical protein BroJett024_38290 [Alphaproteobacteria bacterium]